MKEEIIKHVMEVNDYSREDAINLIEETAEEIICSDPEEASEILMDNLCLEPDYILDVIEFVSPIIV